MTAVAWWGIPLGATLLAVVWVAWAGRRRPPADTHATVSSYQRFRSAMEHDTFGGRRTVRKPEESAAPERPDRQP
jgi:phage gp37-like protein